MQGIRTAHIVSGSWRWPDLVFLAAVVMVSVAPYVAHLGFYGDDWTFLGTVTNATNNSVANLPLVAGNPTGRHSRNGRVQGAHRAWYTAPTLEHLGRLLAGALAVNFGTYGIALPHTVAWSLRQLPWSDLALAILLDGIVLFYVSKADI